MNHNPRYCVNHRKPFSDALMPYLSNLDTIKPIKIWIYRMCNLFNYVLSVIGVNNIAYVEHSIVLDLPNYPH